MQSFWAIRHRVLEIFLACAACLIAAQVGCTKPPTNVTEATGGATGNGGANPTAAGGTTVGPMGMGGGVGATAGTGNGGSVTAGGSAGAGLGGASAGGMAGMGGMVVVDDPSCTEGFPPQEDPAFQRVRTLLETAPEVDAVFDTMMIDEKKNVISGDATCNYANETCFRTSAVDRVNYPEFRMRDGPRGVRGVLGEQATTFPVAEVRAASFDLALEERIGAVVAAEMRAMRVDLMLAPTVNVLRHPQWARAQETYGEDPVLLGEMGAAYVRGMQAGPQGMPACPKHFACNNTDDNRGGGQGNVPGVDVTVDEQNLRENYVRPFQIIVEKSDPACIMAAYNGVNGQASAENTHLLTDILRSPRTDAHRGWEWTGFVISDWDASLGNGRGAMTIGAGLDLEMPTRQAFNELGTANIAEIDRAARRIMTARATFGQLSDTYRATHSSAPDTGIVNTQAHRDLTREAAEKGAVLLKNDGVLPLGTSVGDLGTPEVASIIFLGPDRNIPRPGSESPDTPDPNQNTAERRAHGLGDGGSSQTFPPEIISFLSGVTDRAAGVTVTESANAADAAGHTVAIIPVTMAHFDEGEAYGGGGDRESMTLAGPHPFHWTQKPTEFINAVRAADANVRIIVLLAVGSAIIVEDWIASANAVVQTFYPGQQGGAAAARLLFADINFSGKLPFTVATDPAHYPVFGNTGATATFEYLHGYRRFEANGTPPRYWFGHGLTYTTYEYTAPTVLCSQVGPNGRLNVEVSVTNTGPIAGDEIVQLFVGSPATAGLTNAPPPKELKTFARVSLAPGETKVVQLFVPARDLRHWGPNGWELATGQHTVFVGPSADPAALQSAPFTVN